MFREFGMLDWLGWQGAEKFDDGSNPLIWENDNVSVLITGDQIGIYFDEDGYYAIYSDMSKSEKILIGEFVVKTIDYMGLEKGIKFLEKQLKGLSKIL